mgnify:CR=1 FL=1
MINPTQIQSFKDIGYNEIYRDAENRLIFIINPADIKQFMLFDDGSFGTFAVTQEELKKCDRVDITAMTTKVVTEDD